MNLYMTLDGYGEFPKYPGSDVVPDEPSFAWKEMWSTRYGSVDTVVFGRRSYESHLSVHRESARLPTDPKYMFEYSRWLDRVQKVVLSRTIGKTDWPNSRVMSGNWRTSSRPSRPNRARTL